MTPIRTWARWAGVGYLVIIVTGIYAEFFARGSLIVPGDAAATASNIAGAELLWRSSLASELVMLVADVAVGVALYMVFRSVSEGLALLAAFFRLTHAAVVGAGLLTVYAPVLLLGDAQQQTLVAALVDAHAYGYAVGLVFFGVYCALIGALILRSGYVPRILGWLLVVAAAGYLIDSFARTLLTSYSDYEMVLGMVVLLPAFVAELSFSLWLVVKGVAVPANTA